MSGIVKSCPTNLTETIAASARLKCGKDQYRNDQYICAPNTKKTGLVEYCHKGGIPLVINGYCVETTGGQLYHGNCQQFIDGCPTEPFLANAIYKHPACRNINTESHCYLADPSCPKMTSIFTTRDMMETASTYSDFPNTTTGIFYNTTTSLETAPAIVGSILAGLFVIAVLIMVVCVIWRRKKQQRNRNKKDLKDEESLPLYQLTSEGQTNECAPEGQDNEDSDEANGGIIAKRRAMFGGGNSTALFNNDIEAERALRIEETEALKNKKHVTSFSSPPSTTYPKRDGLGERKPKTTKEEDLKNNKEENEVGGKHCVKSGEENAKTFKTFVDQDILASDKENPDKKLTTDHHSEGGSGINNNPPTDIAENTEGNKENDEDKQDSKGEELSSEIITEDDSPSAPGENTGEKVTKEHDFSTKAEVKNGRNTDDGDTLMTDKGKTGQDDACRQEHTKKDESESRKGKVITIKEQFENEANKPP